MIRIPTEETTLNANDVELIAMQIEPGNVATPLFKENSLSLDMHVPITSENVITL